MKRYWKFLSAFALLVATAAVGYGYISYRNGVMDRLYAEAAGYPGIARGSNESTAALRELAEYRGNRATEMLMRVALGQGPLVFGDTQVVAIRILRNRKDEGIAPGLASLLQPHEGLGIRLAVAETLLELPCDKTCVQQILHYLERLYRGELNDEDRRVFPPGTEELRTTQQKDQETLRNNLASILGRERPALIGALVRVYGLGSTSPSDFALNLVARLGITEACPFILRSQREMENLSADFFKAPRQELQAALAALNCK